MSGLPRAEARPVPPRRHRRRNGPRAGGNVCQRRSGHLRPPGRHSTLVSVGLRHQPFSRFARGCSRRSRQPVPASTAELADLLRSMGQLPGNPPNVGAIPARRRGWRRRPLRPAGGNQCCSSDARRGSGACRLRPATCPGWPTCSCVRLASRRDDHRPRGFQTVRSARPGEALALAARSTC